nr:retrovirus-related Pol polyprotein from transposon TNT 1-94 [Tanacetum cinerariifolium]
MYCLVVTYDYSRFTCVFFLATKDETSGILKSFITRIENLVDHKVKVIRCDNGTEFNNKEMNQFCEMKGIMRQFSVARTPQQNRVAERRNRTLIEAARTMLADSKTPTLSFMRPFRCPITILNTVDHLGKFDGKADEGFFIGYSLNNKAIRVFNSRTRIVEENVHIRFSESTPNVVGSGPDWLFDIDALTRIMNYEPIVTVLKSYHDDGSKTLSDDGKKVNKDPSKESKFNAVGGIISSELPFDPNMYALKDVGIFDFSTNDKDDDVVADMNNLDTTIQVSPTPTTRIHKDHPLDQVIRDFHLATQTRKMSKNLEEHGFVSTRYTQEEGTDYDEVFASVARIEAIRLFLAYASCKDFVVYQMDVKSAFLYEKIKEELYVCQPPGFEDPDFPNRVYKVEKALYGLHQAPRAWYETLSTYLLDNEFQRGKINKTLFIKRHKGDILLISYMRELTFFLGLQVKQKKDGILISQDKYVAKILKKFGFTKVKTASTLMETQNPLLKNGDGKEVDVHMYRYQVNPKVSHLHVVKRTFRDCNEKKLTQMVKIHTDENVADLVTKAFDIWSTAMAKTINGEVQLHARVDGKKIVITESSVRRDLRLTDEEGGGPWCQETMEDTTTQTRMVKKLEKRNRSRTHRLNRLYKVGLSNRVESSSDKECLGKDASKQGKIDAIDADEVITLVSVQDDADKEMFYVNVLGGDEVFVLGKNENVVEEAVDAAQVSTAATIVTINNEEITLAQALKALKTSKPKVKGIVFQEPGKSTTTTTISSQQSYDKGKGIMIEEPVKPKNKDQIRLDEAAAKKLHAEFDEEERLIKEKSKKEERANIALIEEWDDIQATIDADHQLAERLQALKQEELFDAEKATLFQQLLEKRKKHFAAKRAEEKRNKPPTKAQQRKITYTYLKNMEGYKLKDLRLKEFDSI